jgi:hypothetical protein
MIENDYPVPSYMADIFEKPPGWMETPEPKASESKLDHPKIYAIDCEMVFGFSFPKNGFYSTWTNNCVSYF